MLVKRDIPFLDGYSLRSIGSKDPTLMPTCDLELRGNRFEAVSPSPSMDFNEPDRGIPLGNLPVVVPE
ncbi:hypothetical protein V1478_013873 [Vespula squamosa]|uniref:Uncharacterized protein n=1 Tax=Vespula squamosa TaxID=30214 RepID=A0ABD2A788_VESSQ